MKWNEIKLKTSSDLRQLISSWEEDLTKAKILKGYQKHTEKPHLFRLHKRNIARAKMRLKQLDNDGQSN